MVEILIDPPTREDRFGGISDVAEFRPNERLNGTITFISDGCTFPQITEGLCYTSDPDPADKTFDGIATVSGIGDPFPLYAGVKCFIGPDSDFDARAIAALAAGRDRVLEDQLGIWAAGGTALAAGADAKAAIGRVEQALDAGYLGRGIILMSRFDAIMAGGPISADPEGILRTSVGTPVVASGSIEPGTVYGIGAVVVEHSSVKTHQIERLPYNTRWALAEEIDAIAVDCGFRVKSAITA